MEGNHKIEDAGYSLETSSGNRKSTPRRTALREMRKVPLIQDTINKVSSIHGKLENIIPLYSFITSFILQSVSWTLDKIEGFTLIQWTVELWDCILLAIIDFSRSNFPVITLPTQELCDNLYGYVRRQAFAVATRVASFSVSQRMCRTMESALVKLEIFGNAFTVNEDTRLNMPWWYAPNLCFAAYECTVNSAMKFGVGHLSKFRHAVRNFRVTGAQDLAKSNPICCRYKVSPRKSSKRAQPWIGYRLLFWLKNKLYSMMGLPNDVTSSFSSDGSLDDTPNTSQAKKRKLSDVEEEDTCDSNEDLTYHALMNSFSSYNSKEDPDYMPSEPSTDSYEYRVSSEEDYFEKSVLGSLDEVNLLANGAAEHTPSKNNAAIDADEPVIL